jgi:hypothetical protein
MNRNEQHEKREEPGGRNEEAHAVTLGRADWRSVSTLQGIR